MKVMKRTTGISCVVACRPDKKPALQGEARLGTVDSVVNAFDDALAGWNRCREGNVFCALTVKLVIVRFWVQAVCKGRSTHSVFSTPK